jgi:hypothetical protein
MAGNGPAPADDRRRSNAPARGEWKDLDPLEVPVLPELPEIEDGWRADTFAAWTAWREDPVTSQYSPSDIAYALDTIRLHQAMTPTSANEIRLRMDALGLTPKGKRDLRWRIKEPGGGTAQPEPRHRKKSSARRGRLSVVK